jgi:ubiquinone biosynthesis protein
MKLPYGLRRNLRLLAIGHVLATHGLAAMAVRLRLFRPYAWIMRLFTGDELPKDLGVQIRHVLEKLGPTFIKFGQMLSTRVDLLPIEVALELKKLQDDVPPEKIEIIESVLNRAFKKPLTGDDGVFAEFDREPVAAASIAQVHFAQLHNGKHVAVKVRRPRIQKTIEADLSILRLLAGLFDRYFPEYVRLKAPRVVEEFSSTIMGELNLRSEAAHASRFAENLSGVDGVGVPEVMWDYTSMEVLVTERVYGIEIDEREKLAAAGHDLMQLCKRTATLFFHMAFVDGYFHADLHPGNIFVAENGDIMLVDFGIVGRLDMRSRCYIADMLLAFLKQDYKRAAEVHVEAGYVPADTNVSAFEDAMREIAEPIFNRPLKEISLAELLFYLFAVTERFKMETQPELLLLQKTMVVIEGVARELEPEVNVWALAKPLVGKWVTEHLGPKARIEQGAKDLKAGLESWLHLPGELKKMLAEQHVEIIAQEAAQSGWVQLAGVLLLAGGGVLAGLGWDNPTIDGTWIGAVSALIIGLLLLIRR